MLGLDRGFGAEGIMPGTLKQPMELRSEQLRAMGNPMLQGVLGPLQFIFTLQGCSSILIHVLLCLCSCLQTTM